MTDRQRAGHPAGTQSHEYLGRLLHELPQRDVPCLLLRLARNDCILIRVLVTHFDRALGMDPPDAGNGSREPLSIEPLKFGDDLGVRATVERGHCGISELQVLQA